MSSSSRGGGEIGFFDQPSSVAVSEDRVYVCDRGSDRIQVFDLHGRPLTSFGGHGSGDGQFYEPRDIALDGNGNVYVADTGNHRIQKFTADGSFLTKWGSYGSEDGQFIDPYGIAADSSGGIYVADTGNHRIQKFRETGPANVYAYVTQWGSEGTGNGQFSEPRGIAVDGSGYVYVADTGNHRIQTFRETSPGTNVYTYVTQWGSEGTGNGEFSEPQGIAVHGSGYVYVADTANGRVQKFRETVTGTNVYTYVTQWGSSSSVDGQFTCPVGIALDASGHVYVTDMLNNCIQKFTANGSFLAKWGGYGSGDGQFDLLHGIAVDGSGDIYVADAWNHRVQKFRETSPGSNVYAYVTQWGSEGTGNGEFNGPRGIALDGSGDVYVADCGNHRIQKFRETSPGTNVYTYVTQWGSEGTGNGQFLSPIRIAMDGSGDVYVTEFLGHRVQKFRETIAGSNVYTYVTQWGGYGSEDGQFNRPSGIALDGSGDIYVVDQLNHRVQKFRETIAGSNVYTYVTQWGSGGGGDGQFGYPSGIAVDGSGNVYVTDDRNQRIQKFAPGYPTPDPVHGLALNGSFEETPDLVRWTYGGELPVGLVTDAYTGTHAAQLGEPTSQTEHDQGMAWLRQTMYVRPEWERPVLTFHYRMFVNDTIDYSDFHVWLTRSNGGLLAEIKRDGFRSCDGSAPPEEYDLGWRTGYYDLSGFKGQTVRLVFENRNLHGGYSWGIWTYVDDVRVVDAGPRPAPPGPPRAYLPIVMSSPPCDPVAGGLEVESMVRPRRP